MTIHQYVRIIQMCEPPKCVTSDIAAEVLKNDRIIYILQYPYEKMFQLRDMFTKYQNVVAKQNAYSVELPSL